MKQMTHLNTFVPQPAIAVNIRGPKSLAGLMAYPQLYPKAMPITATTIPIQNGTIPLGGFMFLLSLMANTQASKRAVPHIWSPKPLPMER